MQITKLKNVKQFYISEQVIKSFLAKREETGIKSLALNILVEQDVEKDEANIRIMNGNLEEGVYVTIFSEEIKDD